jgi:ribosomal protein S18 acetylase RimI-like enzyme
MRSHIVNILAILAPNTLDNLLKEYLEVKKKTDKPEPVLSVDTTGSYCSCEGNKKTYVIKIVDVVVVRACVHNFTWYGREVRHLFVHEKYRRQGWARHINEEIFKLNNVPFFFATVRTDNVPSYTLLKSIGFKTYDAFISKISKQECVFMCYKKEGYLDDRNTVGEIEENL